MKNIIKLLVFSIFFISTTITAEVVRSFDEITVKNDFKYMIEDSHLIYELLTEVKVISIEDFVTNTLLEVECLEGHVLTVGYCKFLANKIGGFLEQIGLSQEVVDILVDAIEKICKELA